METGQILRKVLVEGKEENLPKEAGWYFCHEIETGMQLFSFDVNINKQNWIDRIDFYYDSVEKDSAALLETLKSDLMSLLIRYGTGGRSIMD